VTSPEADAARHLARVIAETGPVPVATFMEIALAHRSGYYRTRPAIGAEGDFITAPELSQLFGEMIGVFALQSWLDMGSPRAWQLIELGPGRGTLASDLLRVVRIRPQALDGLSLHLVEMSEPLRDAQAHALAGAGVRPRWHERLGDVPETGEPMLILANELFDALPIRQFLRLGGVWCERRVALAPDRPNGPRFVFVATPTLYAVDDETVSAHDARDGEIIEICPAARAIASEIGTRLAHHPGRALIIDYGYDGARHGDTLQAVAQHQKRDPLEAVGACDLSAHVDFRALADAARRAGAAASGPTSQGGFLSALGICTRHAALAARATAAQRKALDHALVRLTSPDAMGDLFKVLILASPGLPDPPGLAS
jgi:NADH dehydrogenase [ubiquinone] 1 alpha subcomplex assembly factor 7